MPAVRDAIAKAPHSLQPGDTIMVVKPGLLSPVERDIVDRLCAEFECREVSRSGPLSLMRLARP